VSDLRAEQVSGLPQLRITVDRSATARVGLSPGDVIRAVRIALVGEKESEIWVGQRRFDLVVRLPDERRNDINAIRSLFIDSHEGTRIPLGQLATIEQAFGPGAIRREAGSRRVAVEASATGRDLGGVASDIQQTLQRDLQLPQGYFFNVGGRVESQARASRSLMTAIALALFAVVLLLYFALDSFMEAAVILVTIPVAFVGGIAGLLLAGETWNVSSLVGLIGLFGIAVQNSLVLVTQTRGLCAEGRDLPDAVREASLSVPVLKQSGDAVFAGTINGEGALEVESTKPAGDSTLAHIVRLVGEAQSQRAPSEMWVERFARVYTPTVFITAIVVALVPPLLFAGSWPDWTYRALVLLVIGCPCALHARHDRRSPRIRGSQWHFD
jgi:heavy metal efflux system protein